MNKQNPLKITQTAKQKLQNHDLKISQPEPIKTNNYL